MNTFFFKSIIELIFRIFYVFISYFFCYFILLENSDFILGLIISFLGGVIETKNILEDLNLLNYFFYQFSFFSCAPLFFYHLIIYLPKKKKLDNFLFIYLF